MEHLTGRKVTREKRWGWACGSAVINTQKRIKKCYQWSNPGVKWQLQRSCFITISPVCVWRTDFIPSFSAHRQVPVTWNLFRRRVNFTLKELGSIIDSTYGTICHCIVSKCLFLSFFPPLRTAYFTTHCLEKEFHIPLSFIKPLLKLYQFRNAICQHYFILCCKHARHKCGLRQVLWICCSGTVNDRDREYKQRWS